MILRNLRLKPVKNSLKAAMLQHIVNYKKKLENVIMLINIGKYLITSVPATICSHFGLMTYDLDLMDSIQGIAGIFGLI